ncbi:hypothetical protein EPA93_12135 [Ktedonosporobacter rubrisoli]|uniref:Histidine kinase/HSP90-like ATPase domain-containing protein n=1 Tax=Ktedonosporobacter rubrisoli TaxID=2509675 RepID=A0A4P6JNR2_KTERU|nr:sensor histidine kinase [Ktedonosporobacter rubrisoli]QBD76712.1 hypothetical protein EPA93_12135 [Ktedonosporobacter rubrisoli]
MKRSFWRIDRSFIAQPWLAHVFRPRDVQMLPIARKKLLILQIAWLFVVLFIGTHILLSFPAFVKNCESPTCAFSPSEALALQNWGVSADMLNVSFMILSLLQASVFFSVATLIFWHTPRKWIALYTGFMLVTLGGTISFRPFYDILAPHSSIWSFLLLLLDFCGPSLWFFFFLLFPDGRFISRKEFVATGIFVLFILARIAISFWPATSKAWYPLSQDIFNLIMQVTAELILIYRYTSLVDNVQRQQSRWVVCGLTLQIAAFLGRFSVKLFFSSYSILVLTSRAGILLAGILLPLTLGIAVLRYRLWDLGLFINRTLVYALLSVCIVALYISIVGGSAILFQTNNNPLVPLLATGLIAALIQPLRAILQRNVNKLLYGERDAPYVVLARLNQRLERTLLPQAALQAITEVAAQALMLPYAAIILEEDGMQRVNAAFGEIAGIEREALLKIPLVGQAGRLGEMVLAPRGPHEIFTESDQKLLQELARRAELVIHAAHLTSNLQRLTSDLQRSREQLVLAREEERYRIRRDLHDGVAPTLAALALSANTISEVALTNSPSAAQMARELEKELRTTIADIRQLAYNLRPPTLDQLGLIAAIREYAIQQMGTGAISPSSPKKEASLKVIVQAPETLQALPAAVEVAAYRIIQEGLMNVVKHAKANICWIRLSAADVLQVEIIDDGIGISAAPHMGIGSLSMRERAEEIGGTCVIESNNGVGTRVCARFPLRTGVVDGANKR